MIHITVPSENVDVNVHPNKMEVRFANQNAVYQKIASNIAQFLANQEMIPEAAPGKDKALKPEAEPKVQAPEPFEKERIQNNLLREESSYNHEGKASKHEEVGQFLYNNKVAYYNKEEAAPQKEQVVSPKEQDDFFVDNRVKEEPKPDMNSLLHKILGTDKPSEPSNLGVIKAKEQIIIEKPEQLNFFDEKILTREAKQEYRIVGQVFDTYWIIEYRDKMLMIDQHAAHEKVKYEQILKRVASQDTLTQTLTPPIIFSVTAKEADVLHYYGKYFAELGFEIEDFGMNAYAIRGVPYDLFSYDMKELFEEILTELSESPVKGVPQIIREKIASMACKAAVKGNNSLTYEEADKLIEQLLELDNPYNCPHGRPTIITLSKYEIEKKFKRIV